MGVTIKDIAEKTGLSITTISLVLNKKDSRISEKTRRIVENTAHELNYSPNQTAISLATKKTNAIGLIIPEGSYYRPGDMVLSFDRACRNSGCSLVLSLPEGDDESCVEAVAAMLPRGVDGIVFDGSSVSGAFYDIYRNLARQAERPVVFLANPRTEAPVSAVAPRYQLGAGLALSHLFSLGHTRIGYILGPRDSCAVQEMLDGIKETLRKAGQESGALPVIYTPYGASGGYGGLEVLLQRNITAVFAGSDIIASGIFRRAFELGIGIPEKLSVIGYGNCAFSADMFIPLTTIAVHFDRIARKAVHIIKRLDRETGPGVFEQVEPSLIIRSSTGPVKQTLPA